MKAYYYTIHQVGNKLGLKTRSEVLVAMRENEIEEICVGDDVAYNGIQVDDLVEQCELLDDTNYIQKIKRGLRFFIFERAYTLVCILAIETILLLGLIFFI